MSLLPCPFCGSNELTESGSFVECDGCLCTGLKIRWNKRYSPWISVKDRLPEEYKLNEGIVLVLTDAGRWTYPSQFVSHYSHETETWCDIRGFIVTTDSRVLRDCQLKVTHWLPLPNPPTDGDL